MLAQQSKVHVLQTHVSQSLLFFNARRQVVLYAALDLSVMSCEHGFKVFELLLCRSLLDQALHKPLVLMIELFIDQDECLLGIQVHQLSEFSHDLLAKSILLKR